MAEWWNAFLTYIKLHPILANGKSNCEVIEQVFSSANTKSVRKTHSSVSHLQNFQSSKMGVEKNDVIQVEAENKWVLQKVEWRQSLKQNEDEYYHTKFVNTKSERNPLGSFLQDLLTNNQKRTRLRKRACFSSRKAKPATSKPLPSKKTTASKSP